MSLATALKKSKPKAKGPVWSGPCGEGPQGGVTQGLISRWLCCRERFRLKVVEGLSPADAFNHRLEYGQMWHVCEEALAEAPNKPAFFPPLWEGRLKNYAQELCQRYRLQQDEIDKWYNVCKVQFPLYVKHWAAHPDVLERTPLLQEHKFSVPYQLPSGRTVRLRGKWDAVDLIGRGKEASVYLQENKSKGDINEQQLKRQLSSGFDLQTMLYVVALEKFYSEGEVRGVRYNVVKRPLSGGRGSIVRHKATKNQAEETKDAYFKRLSGIIEASPEEFFMRWKIEVTPGDVARFRRECLDPILEQLVDWWEHVTYAGGKEPFGPSVVNSTQQWVHWRHPSGVYNVLNEGGESELDEHLATGSEIGLQRTDDLFPELKT